MELYYEQERLVAALKAVLPAVPSRSWATVEAGMLLRANGLVKAGSHLAVIATDREMTIRCQVGAQATKSGEVVLPARTISDLVAMLDHDRVDVSLDEEAGVLALRCRRTLAHVRGWKAEEFPELPVPAGDPVAITADVPAEGAPRPMTVRPVDEADRQVTVIMPMSR